MVSLESEKPSVELRAGDKIRYYENAHVGRRVVAYKISDKNKSRSSKEVSATDTRVWIYHSYSRLL